MTEGIGSAIDARLGWRPQRFGRRNAKNVADPLIEPLWPGVRVLAHLEQGGEPTFVDEDGERLELDEIAADGPALALAIRQALAAESATIDGYVTYHATRSGEGVTVEAPQTMSSSAMIGHFLVGGMAQGAAKSRLEGTQGQVASDPGARDSAADDTPIAFVAVDLLMVDGEPVLDVPLLERKRLLASVVREGPRVRITPHVRLPIDTWVMSWRASGFRGIAYKSANSRYRPGAESEEWATASMPMR